MGTTFSLIEKDADLYAALADAHDVPLLLGQTIRQLVIHARAEFGESADWTNLHRFFRDTMGSHEPR
jgi:3-hydroxyisobutyrate dehydrogenase-like beta-hydroxyacid dehydrogenase